MLLIDVRIHQNTLKVLIEHQTRFYCATTDHMQCGQEPDKDTERTLHKIIGLQDCRTRERKKN